MLKKSISYVKDLYHKGRFQPKKLRVLVAWLSVFPIIYYSHPSEESFRLGLPLLLLGELVRVWSVGSLEKKGIVLTITGPYAYIRNPLYLGNFMIGIACVIISANIINLFIFLPIYLWIYRSTVAKEEAVLLKTFGNDYRDYCKQVRRFMPRIPPYKNNNKTSFSFRRLIICREYDTFIGIACFALVMYIFEEGIIENDFGAKVIVSICCLFFLGCLNLLAKKIRSITKVSE